MNRRMFSAVVIEWAIEWSMASGRSTGNAYDG